MQAKYFSYYIVVLRMLDYVHNDGTFGLRDLLLIYLNMNFVIIIET